MELVLISCRPLDVNPGLVGRTHPTVKHSFENGWIEVIVEGSCRKRFYLLDDVTNRQQRRPIRRAAERMGFRVV